MKSFFILFLIIGLAILGFISYGRSQIENSATNLLNDAKESYENVASETTEVIDKAKAAKAKVEETIDDFNNAVEKVEETKNAISEITE